MCPLVSKFDPGYFQMNWQKGSVLLERDEACVVRNRRVSPHEDVEMGTVSLFQLICAFEAFSEEELNYERK